MRKTMYLISKDEKLKSFFEKDERIDLTLMHDEPRDRVKTEIIYLDGEEINHQQLSDMRVWYPDLPIFYKYPAVTSATISKSIQAMCEAYNILPISEYSSAQQIYEEVMHRVFDLESESHPRVFSFFGTHSGAGVSTTVFNLAKCLASQVKQKVIVLSLNPWDPSDYFLEYSGRYLNDLKIDLKLNTLNEQKFMESIQYYDEEGFYHLAGNWDVKMQRYFTVDEMAKLIELAKSCFDVVLIDGGTHYDNACSIQSFKAADLKFLVTTQEDKGYRCYWRHAFQQMIEPIEGNADSYLLILNRYIPGASLITDKEIQKELEMTLLTTIPDQNILASIAISQKKLLIDSADSQYKRSLQLITNSIIARAHLSLKDDMDERSTGFFTKLFKKDKQPV